MKKRMNRIVILLFSLVIASAAHAQDPQYSQFYAAPLYINPAFTGLTAQHRIVANLRDQWPGLPNDYISTSFSYDRNVESLNSGFGIVANGQLAGEGMLWKAEIAPTYAYHAVINDDLIIRPGVKVGVVSTGINKNKLVFNDQLSSGQSTVETNLRNSRTFLDFSAGVLAMTEMYWGGMSFNHINTPDESLLRDSPESEVPMKFSLHGGVKLTLDKFSPNGDSDKDVSAMLHYKAQAKYDQLDIGVYYNTNPVVLGLWYRGLPLKQNVEGYGNSDAITLLFGVRHPDEWSLGFSYDITISRLGVSQTAGSFELSFVREWAVKKKKRRRSFIIPCAKF